MPTFIKLNPKFGNRTFSKYTTKNNEDAIIYVIFIWF